MDLRKPKSKKQRLFTLTRIFFRASGTCRFIALIAIIALIDHFSSVQSLSRVWLFAAQLTAACQASLSITKLRSIKSVMPYNHLIFCHPLLLLPSIIPSIRVFSNESILLIRWPKYWSFSFSVSPSNEYSGFIFLGLTGLISLVPKGFWRVFSSTTIQKHQFFDSKPSYGLTHASRHDNWKNRNFNSTDLCQQSDVSVL